MPKIQNVFILGVALLLLVLLISRITQQEHIDPGNKPEAVKRLTRQAFRWYVASTQDNNPVIKGLHADYAVAYADILKQMATRDEILQITNLDIDQFMQAATNQQDEYLVELAKRCPKLLPDDSTYRKYINDFLNDHFQRK